MPDEVYMTVKELATYLKLNIQTIYRMINREGGDRLPSLRIGRAVRFSKDAVDGWMAESSRKS